MIKKLSEWTTKEINDLPDSSFCYVEAGGEKDDSGKTTPRSKRHLPYKDADGKVDLPHVRNALARLADTKIPDDVKPGIKAKLEKALGSAKASDRLVGVFPFEFDAKESGGTAIPNVIHLIPIGSWDHDMYGPIIITGADIQQFKDNFDAHVRNGVFITAGHEGFEELPAVGWIESVEVRDTGLWGAVEWNPDGKELLSEKAFKFFSPEFYQEYADPQTHQVYKNVLTGGALTKSPYFKELEALVMSEKKLKKSFNENKTMNLNELVDKDITTLSDEEKAFIKEHASELTEDQKTKVISIVEDAGESEEEKTAREAKEAQDKADADAKKATEDANVAAGLNPDGTAKVNASEKVMISAGELTLLKKQADEGQKAFAEIKKQKMATALSALVFSDANSKGKFMPKSSDNLRAFMETLSDVQMQKFSDLIGQIPQTAKEMFKELGGEGASDGSAEKEVGIKVEAKMKDTKMSYSDSLKAVMSENPDLAKRYDEEVAQ